MLFITTPEARPEVKTLITAAQALKWSIFNDGWRVPDRLREERGAVYGGKIFCDTIADQMNWKIVRNPSNWLATLPEEYVSRKITLMNVAEARKITNQIFVKPTIETWFKADKSLGTEIPKSWLDDIPLLVSDVMKFTSEYRCVVKHRKVITACCYYLRDKTMESRNLQAEYDLAKNYYNNHDDVVRFVSKMLDDSRVECVDSCVIDVGRFDKDKYAVFNTKPANLAEMYGCEPVAMLDAIKSSCEMAK